MFLFLFCRFPTSSIVQSAAFGDQLALEEILLDPGSVAVAAAGGYTTLLRELVRHGLDVSTVGDDGFSPLLYAVCCGHSECVKILLAHGKYELTEYLACFLISVVESLENSGHRATVKALMKIHQIGLEDLLELISFVTKISVVFFFMFPSWLLFGFLGAIYFSRLMVIYDTLKRLSPGIALISRFGIFGYLCYQLYSTWFHTRDICTLISDSYVYYGLVKLCLFLLKF